MVPEKVRVKVWRACPGCPHFLRAAAQTAGSKTLFTVKSAYRPKTFPAAVPSITANAQTAQIWTTGGFSPVVSAISAGTNLQFNGVYFIGS